MNRTSGFLLNDRRPRSNFRPPDQVACLDLDEVASAKLAVDCKIKQGTVANSPLPIQEEADCPDLFLGQRAFGPNTFASLFPRASARASQCLKSMGHDNAVCYA